MSRYLPLVFLLACGLVAILSAPADPESTAVTAVAHVLVETVKGCRP